LGSYDCRVDSPAPVLILSGPPGAGKTTAAELLAARWERTVHLESDLFFRAIRSGYVEPWRPESREQNEAIGGIVAGVAAGYAAAGYFTIVDGIVIPGWLFEPLRDSIRDAGHAVAFAVLRAPLELCVERVEARDSDGLADPAVVEQLWNSFAHLGPLEQHAVDVGSMSPDATADVLEQRLRDGSLVPDGGQLQSGR
jgi:tRNA uridine 5-carbamoylmethylation protein Kti12